MYHKHMPVDKKPRAPLEDKHDHVHQKHMVKYTEDKQSESDSTDDESMDSELLRDSMDSLPGQHTNIYADVWMKTPFNSSALDAAMQMFSEDKGTSQNVQQLRGKKIQVVYNEMLIALKSREERVVVSFAKPARLYVVSTAALWVVVKSPTKISERLRIIMPQGCRAKLQLLRWMWPQKPTLTVQQVMESPMFYTTQITGNPADVVDSFVPSPFERFKKNGKLDVQALLKVHPSYSSGDDPDASIAVMSATFRLANEEVEESGTNAYAAYQAALTALANSDPPVPTTYRKPAEGKFGGDNMELQDLRRVAVSYASDDQEKHELAARWTDWLLYGKGTWNKSKSSRRSDRQPGGLSLGEPPRKYSRTEEIIFPHHGEEPKAGSPLIATVYPVSPPIEAVKPGSPPIHTGNPESPLIATVTPVVHTDIIALNTDDRVAIINRARIALALKSIDEMYAVLPQIHQYFQNPSAVDTYHQILAILQLEVMTALGDATSAPVPQRFLKPTYAWDVTKAEIKNLLELWAKKNQNAEAVADFLAFVDDDQKFNWGVSTDLTQLDDEIRRALQAQNMKDMYGALDNLLSLPADKKNEKPLHDLKEYIMFVMKNMPIPPLPEKFEKKIPAEWTDDGPLKKPHIKREYLSHIVDAWIETHKSHPEHKKVGNFLDFLHNEAKDHWSTYDVV